MFFLWYTEFRLSLKLNYKTVFDIIALKTFTLAEESFLSLLSPSFYFEISGQYKFAKTFCLLFQEVQKVAFNKKLCFKDFSQGGVVVGFYSPCTVLFLCKNMEAGQNKTTKFATLLLLFRIKHEALQKLAVFFHQTKNELDDDDDGAKFTRFYFCNL